MTSIKHFGELTGIEVYAMLRLRSEVFVVEQQSLFLDIDSIDIRCHHVLIQENDRLKAYSRLVPPGIAFTEMSIGRIVTSKDARGSGKGKNIMNISIDGCYNLFGTGPIKIGAQLYLKKFYEGFGFIQAGSVYVEDGIDHIHMIKE